MAPGPPASNLEELDVLFLVTQRLEGAGLAYMLSGSMALNHYAQPRMTRDLDLIVELSPGQERLVYALFEAEFQPDLEEIQDAVRRRRMFNLIHVERVVKVDLVVRKETPYRLEEFRRRRRVVYAGRPLWIVSPEDLLLSKLAWAKDSRSDYQLRDVRRLVAAVGDLDWSYIVKWAVELDVLRLVDEVRGE